MTILTLFVQEVESLDGDGPVALYIHGHCDIRLAEEAMRQYAKSQWDEDLKGPVYITWWRNVPNRNTGGTVFRKAKRGSRGACPVTVCDLRPWEA
jgi:hypothetical protein